MSNLTDFIGGGDVPQWVSGKTYSVGLAVRSPTNQHIYVRIVTGAGTVDPASDATNWKPDQFTVIKSIQRGVITTATVTVSAVNTSRSKLNFLGIYQGDGSGFNTAGHIALTNATTITKTSPGGLAYSVVSWELIEYY